jgi:hypothetical protein
MIVARKAAQMDTRKIYDGPVDVDNVAYNAETQSGIGLTELIEEEEIPLGDVVAAVTESPLEAEIDARNGLRHKGGRRPLQADFEDILTPAGDSGDVVGADVADAPFALGETGSTGGTLL